MTYTVYCHCGTGGRFDNKHEAAEAGWRELPSVGATKGETGTPCSWTCPECVGLRSDGTSAEQAIVEKAQASAMHNSSLAAMHE